MNEECKDKEEKWGLNPGFQNKCMGASREVNGKNLRTEGEIDFSRVMF